MISDIDDVASYTVLHNGTNVLRRGLSSSSIIEKVGFIGEKAKDHTYRYFKIIGECINPALYAWIIIERVTVEIAGFRDVLLYGRVLERYGNISFDKGSASEGDEALKM